MTPKKNHLANQQSPYLLQHADNPVAWYPWGDEALQLARKENKPILLSIGYAACHWCHVMAHESFEDEETAKIMNTYFINIKVDREERPDLDKIYQTTHYLLTRKNGGWPLTVFLSPKDLTPFYSGTYFPKDARYQLPGFKELLLAIIDAYQHQAQEITQQNASLIEFLNRKIPLQPTTLSIKPISLAMTILEDQYDPVHGGFGDAPKFPQPMRLAFLLQHQPEMALQTLLKIARSGLYDQLDGGFFRYSVDAGWQIPHFEKMLYDNAQLLTLYSLAYAQTHNTLFAEVAKSTATWIIQSMQSPIGGFYASMDADSEGIEGKYYLWSDNELQTLLTPDEFNVCKVYYGFTEAPIEKAKDGIPAKWHLRCSQSIEHIAKTLHLDTLQVKNLILSAKDKLRSARTKRVPPTTDQKILTAWNALTIKALLLAGKILQQPDFTESAHKALTYLLNQYEQLHFLPATNSNTNINGFLDDYVFLIDAMLTSLQIEWQTTSFTTMIQLTNQLIDLFYDQSYGGFYFTASDEEQVLYRPKNMLDEAVPSGNGVAVQILSALGYLSANPDYLHIAEKTLVNAWPALTQYPAEHCTLLLGLQAYLHPYKTIILRGTPAELKEWRASILNPYDFVLAIPNDTQDLPRFLADKTASADHACAYICEKTQCNQVLTDKKEFEALMKNGLNVPMN